MTLSIQPSTPTISVNSLNVSLSEYIDYESTPELSVEVIVTTALQTELTLHLVIDIYDVNEAFTVSLSHTIISENAQLHAIVADILADDPDRGQVVSFRKLNEVCSQCNMNL